eukprot:scaffold6103_cov116-Cylindrotheca_fusiformis.AAC.6
MVRISLVQIVLLVASCSFTAGRIAEPRVLEGDSWTDRFSDFFTDDRCLRTEKKTDKLRDLSSWMSKLPNANTTRLLDITLPGTHNSAAYDLTTDENLNDPEYSIVESGTFDISVDFLSAWTCGYAITQSLSISEQLQAGARYLDLRIDYDSATSTWRGFHFLFGLEMTVLLNQISTFAKANPKEIIVIEFGPIYNPEVTDEQREDYKRKITNTFAGNLIPTTTDLSNVTIGSLQEAGTNIMAVVTDDQVAGGTDVLWDDQIIENTVPMTDDVNTMVTFNENRLEDFHNRTEENLYKIQWILTPSSNYIKKHLLDGTLYLLAQDANDKLNDFKRPANSANTQLGNILSVDYIETSPLIQILGLQSYSNGEFVAEKVPPQSKWTALAKVGLGVGLVLLLCGCCCIRKWCKGRKKEDKY